MTKKIFRISSMTLGLVLLLLGNGINHAKADFTIKWPKDTNFSVYEVLLTLTTPNQEWMPPIASGTASGTSYNKIKVIGTINWSFYQQGVINIKVKTETGNKWKPFASIPMTLWKKAENNPINPINDSINDVLNNTTLTLNSNGTATVTYPN